MKKERSNIQLSSYDDILLFVKLIEAPTIRLNEAV